MLLVAALAHAQVVGAGKDTWRARHVVAQHEHRRRQRIRGDARVARRAFAPLLLPLLIAVVIIFTYDMLDTHQGIVTISQQPLLDLLQTMESQPGK